MLLLLLLQFINCVGCRYLFSVLLLLLQQVAVVVTGGTTLILCCVYLLLICWQTNDCIYVVSGATQLYGSYGRIIRTDL